MADSGFCPSRLSGELFFVFWKYRQFEDVKRLMVIDRGKRKHHLECHLIGTLRTPREEVPGEQPDRPNQAVRGVIDIIDAVLRNLIARIELDLHGSPSGSLILQASPAAI